MKNLSNEQLSINNVAEKLYQAVKKTRDLEKLEETVNEEKLRKLLELQEEIDDILTFIFENNNEQLILDAVEIANKNNEHEVAEEIVEHANLDICYFDFEGDDNKDYVSYMLALPFTLITKEENITLPSITHMESVMQKHLFNARLISDKDHFSLGARLIDYESINDMTMNDWWNMHRSIVMEKETDEQIAMSAQKYQLVVSSPLSMFYLIPTVTMKMDENNPDLYDKDEEILSNIINDPNNSFIWEAISKELSNSTMGLSFMPPDELPEVIYDSQYVYQITQLELLFSQFKEYENIEVGYIKTQDPDLNVIFLFDNEDYALASMFIYENNEVEDRDMINILVEQAEGFVSQKLWYFDSKLTMEELEHWRTSDNIYVDKLLKSGHEIDIGQYNQFMNAEPQKYLH